MPVTFTPKKITVSMILTAYMPRKIQRQDLRACGATAWCPACRCERAIEALGVLGASRRQGVQHQLRGGALKSSSKWWAIPKSKTALQPSGPTKVFDTENSRSPAQAGAARQSGAVSNCASR